MPSQSDHDARIRDRAYQIWLREGRPHGHDEAHWRQAEREIDAEEAGTRKTPTRSASVKEAPVPSEAAPSTVSRARAKDEATSKKPRTRAAAAAGADAPATGAAPQTASRRTSKTTR